MGAMVVSGFFGVAFWAVAARIATPDDVGIATAAIAGAGLLVALCDFGVGGTLIQFAGGKENAGVSMVNTAVAAGWLVSGAVSVIFLLGLPFWAEGLLVLRRDAMLGGVFLAFTLASYMLGLQDGAMLSQRRAAYVFWRTLACNAPSVLILLPVVYVVGEGRAPFVAFALPNIVVAGFVGLVVLPRVFVGYRFFGSFDRSTLSTFSSYALKLHLANVFWGAPTYVLPLIAIGTLSPSETAFFAMSWMVLNFVLVIPRTMASALFVSGAHEPERVTATAANSLIMMLALLLPTIAVLWFVGERLLRLFGRDYVHPALLQLLLVSAIPYAVNGIFFMVLRLRRKLVLGISYSAFIAGSTVGLTYFFASQFGLNGLAWGWLTAQLISTLVAFALITIYQTHGAREALLEDGCVT
jgi:O-antigen/teichoic acid export membrane protein